jgi:hypothetical protein
MGLFDGSSSTSTSSTSVPDWAKQYYQAYLGQAQDVASTPYQAYTGQKVAGLNDTQMQALNAVQQRATQGNELLNSSSQGLQSTAQGQYLGTQAAANPSANATNPYAQADNPYLQQSIDAASQDVTRNYNLSVRPQMDQLAAASGSFGNSGVQQMQVEQQRQLGSTLGNLSNSMRSADYNQRAQLAENATNRQFQAGQSLASAQNSLYDSERSRQMQAAQMAPTYATQDYTDASNLMSAGTTLQNAQQQGLDWQYQQYQNALNYPTQQLQTFGQALGVNTGNTTTTTTNPGSASAASQLLAGGLLGYSLFGG